MIQPTLAQAAHALAEVREDPALPGHRGTTGWVAVCVCGHESPPMQGPASAERWLRRMHIAREVAA